jgi:hypothetical protein
MLRFCAGAGSALLGKRAAMACTVAVEEVITEHYNDQLRTLSADPNAARDPRYTHIRQVTCLSDWFDGASVHGLASDSRHLLCGWCR